MQTKTCTKCKKEQLLEEFGKKKNSVDGHNWHCKSCVRLYARESYAKNPDRIRQIKREFMARHRATPQGRENQRQIQRKCRRNGGAERQKKYLANLRDKHFFVWRSRTRAGLKNTSPKELASLWKQQRGRCVLSGRKLDRTAHIDHIVPRSKGGTNDKSNLRWLDPIVNVMRQNLSDQEFIDLCKQICEFNDPSLSGSVNE